MKDIFTYIFLAHLNYCQYLCGCKLNLINNNDKQPLYQKTILHIKILFAHVLNMCITRFLR